MMVLLDQLRRLFEIMYSKRYCPICRKKNIVFHPLPDFYRVNAEKNGYLYFGQGEMTSLETYLCPICGSSDRERLYAYWLKNNLMNQHSIKMIHFAPEASLSKWIKNNYFSIQYETADLEMKGVDHQINIMNMPFKDESYDIFICSHVLEHVADDGLAVSELYRILKPGGCGILMAPICTKIEHTLEDKRHTTEVERWKHYGQGDHVRLYSRSDYVDLIKNFGFNIAQLGIDYFGKKVFKRLGLKKTSVLYIVEKK
jgi:SAM-dependent methyltransferase